VYYQLTRALKRRFIHELRRYWQYHPFYPELTDNIQGKYSFQERPQESVVVRASGGSRFDLSADNYVGIVESYIHLAKVANHPGLAIEWVREDARAIQENNGRFPSPPGIYYLELVEDNEFVVTPLYDVYNEQVMLVDAQTAQLQVAFSDGSLRLYEMPSGILLYEDINYTATKDAQGNPTGEILLVQAPPTGRYLVADYRYAGTTSDPHTIYQEFANNQAIPGAVLAFGRRNKKGDQMAIVVDSQRVQAASEYGGRFDISLEFEITARDPDAQEDIIDQMVIYIWGILRPRLSNEGLEITDLSMGGEGEEVYDEAGDDYFYTANFSVTVQTEWSVYVPLNVFLRQVAPWTNALSKRAAAMTDEQAALLQSDLEMKQSLGLEYVRDAFYVNRPNSFPMIK